MAPPIEHSFRRITILWLISLAAVALVALSSDLLFGDAVTRSEQFADIVNTAGRQRTLSQQIALNGTLYASAQTVTARVPYALNLRRAVESMRSEHGLLLENAQSRPLLLALYEGENGITAVNEAYWQAAADLLALPPDDATPRAVPYLFILNNAPFVLSKLDTAVSATLNESIREAARLHDVNNLRLLVVFGLIGAQYFFVFRPTMVRLRSRAGALEHEIAERKRAESELRASEARFRSLAETAPVGIFQSAPDGAVKWVNNRWEELMNLPGADAYGRTWTETIHPEDLQRIQNESREQRARGSNLVMVDYRIVRRDGVTLDLHATSTLERDGDGKVVGSIGTIMDITQRKLAEERAVKLESERQRIKVLGEFIRNTSHDLRTPLTLIKSGLYFCRKLTDVDKIHERAASIEEYVNYLNIVIDQLQDMAVLDTLTDITLMPMDISLVLRDVARGFAGRADAANKTLTLDISPDLPHAFVSPERLLSGLKAVLDNARRYTPDGGHITFSAVRAGDWVAVIVADDGPGIAAEHLPQVFERFFKVDAARGMGGGAGLGLPIARRVMELHGGAITLESVLGSGTTVTMTLRAALNPQRL